MSHNVKVRYYARENTKMKPHSFYAQTVVNGTYGFDQLCQQAARNTTVEEDTIRQSVREYMRIAQQKICDGFRVEIGPQFLSLAPSLTAKIKDELNQDGTVKRAVTAADLKATFGKSRVSATVNAEFSAQVASTIKWQKCDKQGNPLEPDEDDATLDPDDPQNPASGSGDNTGGDNGGGDNGGGEGLNE